MYHGSGTDVTRASQATGQPADAAACAAASGGRTWNDVMADILNSVSVNRCVFTWRRILPNFITIRLKTTEPWTFFEERRPKKKKNNNKLSCHASLPVKAMTLYLHSNRALIRLCFLHCSFQISFFQVFLVDLWACDVRCNGCLAILSLRITNVTVTVISAICVLSFQAPQQNLCLYQTKW